MNNHQNARITVHGRALLVHKILVERWRVTDAAEAAGISERSAYKWLARFRAGGARMLHYRRLGARPAEGARHPGPEHRDQSAAAYPHERPGHR